MQIIIIDFACKFDAIILSVKSEEKLLIIRSGWIARNVNKWCNGRQGQRDERLTDFGMMMMTPAYSLFLWFLLKTQFIFSCTQNFAVLFRVWVNVINDGEEKISKKLKYLQKGENNFASIIIHLILLVVREAQINICLLLSSSTIFLYFECIGISCFLSLLTTSCFS